MRVLRRSLEPWNSRKPVRSETKLGASTCLAQSYVGKRPISKKDRRGIQRFRVHRATRAGRGATQLDGFPVYDSRIRRNESTPIREVSKSASWLFRAASQKEADSFGCSGGGGGRGNAKPSAVAAIGIARGRKRGRAACSGARPGRAAVPLNSRLFALN